MNKIKKMNKQIKKLMKRIEDVQSTFGIKFDDVASYADYLAEYIRDMYKLKQNKPELINRDSVHNIILPSNINVTVEDIISNIVSVDITNGLDIAFSHVSLYDLFKELFSHKIEIPCIELLPMTIKHLIMYKNCKIDTITLVNSEPFLFVVHFECEEEI